MDAFAPGTGVGGRLGFGFARQRRFQRLARTQGIVEQDVGTPDVVLDMEPFGRPFGERRFSAYELGHPVDALRRHARDGAVID